MKKLALLYGCILFLQGLVNGQQPGYHVQKFPGKNGLVQHNQVEEMMRDSKGFLWLLTPTKAQRFDGKNILSFSFDDRFIGIQEDDEGTVWIAARQNIYRFKNEYEGFEKLVEYSSTVNRYLSLLAGPRKKLYLLTTAGILRWNPADNKMEPMGITPFEAGGSFNFLKSYGDWLFYRLGSATVVRYNVITGAQDSVHVQESNYMVPVDEDHVWMRQGVGGTALVSFKTKTVMPVNQAQFDEAFTDNNFFITAAFEGQPGSFFTILRDKGYFSYNPATNKFKRIRFFNNGQLLRGNPLLTRNDFFEEKDGTAWFTNEEGIFLLNPYTANISLLRSADSGNGDHSITSGWNNDVRNFAEDNKGNIWFSTANGFCKWDKTGGSIKTWYPDFTATNYLNYPSVKAMGFSSNKIIIGQSEKGFWIFDPVKETFSRPGFEADSLKQKFEAGFNANMLQLRNGNFLLFSGSVWIMDKNTFYVKPVKLAEAALRPRKGYEDAQGRIWLLGAGGIAAMDKNFNVLYSSYNRERGNWYNAIVQIDENTFWIASKSLYEIKLKPQQQLAISRIFPDLKSQHFSNLFKDSLGHIWMCSDDGMYRYIPQKNIVEKFDLSDNIQNFYPSVSNSFRGSDGTVYFGSLNGINYFVPEKIPLQNDSLQVHLLNVTVNKDDSTFLIHHSLPGLRYDQNAVVFDFVSPWLYNAEKVQYRYRLDGADQDWVYMGNNSSVRFNSLQPGKYLFHASASINGKDWYDMKSPFGFSIKPPFWQTWWFISLAFTSIAALALFIIKRRISFIKKREAEKTELQKIKAATYQSKLETEQVINYFASSISGQTTVEEMLWDVARNLIGKLGFEDCMIYLWNQDKTILMQRAGYGSKGSMQAIKDKELYHIPKGKGIVGASVETSHYIIANDTSLDSRYFSTDEKIRLSELCVPIIYNNEAMGAINTENSEKNFYTDRHLQVLTTIASMLADKIYMIEAQELARQKEIEMLKLNKDLVTSQLTALRAQMNPHFIFNAMNSIQQFTLTNDVDNANLYISKFSSLLRKVLHTSQQPIVTLEEELEQLELYLSIESLRLQDFCYRIKADVEIELDAVKIPGMLIQPFVENAIKHGLSPKAGDKILSIEVRFCETANLQIVIEDNGIGRFAAEAIRMQNEKLLPHQSRGMQLVEERLHLFNQYDKKGKLIHIADLEDGNGNACGTRVVLNLPLAINET